LKPFTQNLRFLIKIKAKNVLNVEKTTSGEHFWPAALAFPIYRDSASLENKQRLIWIPDYKIRGQAG
jgi:hypothetical protein